MQLAHKRKLEILQKVISSKIYNILLKSMYNKTKQEKNTQKNIYKLRYLNIKEVEAFFIKEEEN